MDHSNFHTYHFMITIYFEITSDALNFVVNTFTTKFSASDVITPHLKQQMLHILRQKESSQFPKIYHIQIKSKRSKQIFKFFLTQKNVFVVGSGQHKKKIEKNEIYTAALIFEGDGLRKITTSKYQVLYMSSSFWLLGVESRDFSHLEKERTACKAEQIHKMTIIITQNGPRLSFSVKIVLVYFVNLPSIASRSFFLSLRKIT